MFLLCRKHIVPSEIHNMADIVIKLYENYFSKNDVLPTSFEIDRVLRKKFRTLKVWQEQTFALDLPTYKDLLNAIHSDSFHSFLDDKKPSSNDFIVHGRITLSRAACPICMDETGIKIRLRRCQCVFHRTCIQQAVKYSKRCPVCQESINMHTVRSKRSKCNEEKEREKEIVHTIIV
jgi:hypothetical protein